MIGGKILYKSQKMYRLALTSRYHKEQYFIRKSYIDWLKENFLLNIILPRDNHEYNDIVHQCDALLIIGGDDINPTLYDQTLHYYTHLEDSLIEEMDFHLIDSFYKEKKPIIGICRGIQVINVYFEGTLIQHIPDYKTIINHNKDIHKIVIDNTSLLHKYFPQSLFVNSFHHQCVKDIPHLFHISAISEDGFIEAIEYKNIIGVQWHPEKMDEIHQKNFILLIIDLIHLSKNNRII